MMRDTLMTCHPDLADLKTTAVTARTNQFMQTY